MSERPGPRPAPYLASRGIKCGQRFSDESMSDEDLKAYVRESYRLVLAGLPRRAREGLGV